MFVAVSARTNGIWPHSRISCSARSSRFNLRGEFYNAFNHVQWSTIHSAAKFNASGQQINILFGEATAGRGPRLIQVAMRVSF
jgi:hypothetical protein